MKPYEALSRAIKLATAMHEHQFRENGEPYILHCIRVMQKFSDPMIKTVAILHDIIEDTIVNIEDLHTAGFDEDIVALVELLTKRDGEEYFDYLARLSLNPIARQVKMADLEDNLDILQLGMLDVRRVNRMAKYLKAYRGLEGISNV
jgi:(p)ppGpp synthase/HD superfamily hydrolase